MIVKTPFQSKLVWTGAIVAAAPFLNELVDYVKLSNVLPPHTKEVTLFVLGIAVILFRMASNSKISFKKPESM